MNNATEYLSLWLCLTDTKKAHMIFKRKKGINNATDKGLAPPDLNHNTCQIRAL